MLIKEKKTKERNAKKIKLKSEQNEIASKEDVVLSAHWIRYRSWFSFIQTGVKDTWQFPFCCSLLSMLLQVSVFLHFLRFPSLTWKFNLHEIAQWTILIQVNFQYIANGSRMMSIFSHFIVMCHGFFYAEKGNFLCNAANLLPTTVNYACDVRECNFFCHFKVNFHQSRDHG